MNKYIFALILTLLGWTQIQAQNTDLRSAPDVPTFQVTVNISAMENGTVTAKVGDTEIKSGDKVAYGSTLDFTIVTNSGYKLTEVANGSDKVTNFTDVTFADGKTTYKVTFKGLTGIADFKFTTAEKEMLSNLNILNLDQALTSLEHIQEVKVSGDLGGFTVMYLYSGSSTDNPYEPFDAKRFTDFGSYSIMITRAEDKDYKAFSQEYFLMVTPKMATITYSVDPTNMGESLAATLNGSDGQKIQSGENVAPSSVLTFTFIPKSGYRLEKILWEEPNRYYTDFRSQLVNGLSVYTFGTPSITDNSSFVFYAVEKDDRKDLENLTINNLKQNAGALQDVTVSGAPEGVTLKVMYQLDGKWTETLDKNLAAGSYKVLVVCAEDLNYKEWSKEATLEIKAGGSEQPIEPGKIAIVLNTDNLTATAIEVGNFLSTSILNGGYAQRKDNSTIVSGSFEWKYPNTQVDQAGEAGYPVLFIPNDKSYETLETSVKVKAIQYYTVTAGKCENGIVTITNANTSGRYEANTKLTVKAVPDIHYVFDAWVTGDEIYTVTEDANLEAKFKPILRTVTIGEGITVLHNGQAVTNSVIEGAVLTVTASKENSELKALTCNDLPVINNTVTVADKDLVFKANFEALTSGTQLLTVDYAGQASKNGKVQLYDENGNIIESGSAVAEGATIQVVAVPDYGYVADALTVTGATLSDSKFTVGTSAVAVQQTFKKATYTVTLPTMAANHVTVELEPAVSGKVDYQTELKINSATVAEGYKLVAILVNGVEVTTGSTFTVTADTKVNAVVEEKPTLQFADTKQTRVYTTNANVQNFILRTIPAGATGLNVSYKQGDRQVTNPTNAGTYDVYVSYAENTTDKTYKLPSEKIGTFEITKAQYPANIPTKDQVGEQNEEKAYYWKGEAEGNFRIAVYRLTEEQKQNYEEPRFSILYTDADLNYVQFLSATPAATKAALRASQIDITLQAVGGRIIPYNGPKEIGNVTTYVGQTITLKAFPDASHTVKGISWTVDDKQMTAAEDGSLTMVMPNKATTIKAVFATKSTAPTPSFTITNGIYNGVIYGGAKVQVAAGWNVYFKQDERIINEPIAADEYEVWVSRAADADYKATELYLGNMTIAKAAPVLTDLNGSVIQQGSPLSQSVISGTSNAEGTFAWANPDQVMNTVGEAIEASIRFTSSNPNYADATGTAKVCVKAQDTTTRQLILTTTGAENGTVNMTLNGTEVTSGTAISQGQTLVVTAMANDGYIAEVKINGESKTEFTIGEAGNVKVTVTFTKVTEPGTEPENPGGGTVIEPDPITPTVSNPMVAERTGTTAVITWEKVSGATSYKLFLYAKKGDSTPLKAYEFDKNGNLKATSISFTLTELEEGKAYYVETAAYNASGTLLVKKGVELSATPTGIESIAEGSLLYAVKGAIVIVPTSPIEVMIVSANGRPIFHDEVAGYTQVTANAGIYVVVIKKGANTITEKVIVK